LTQKKLSDHGLKETDFTPFVGYQMDGSEPNFRPDFSATGGEIQFDCFPGNSTVAVSGWDGEISTRNRLYSSAGVFV